AVSWKDKKSCSGKTKERVNAPGVKAISAKDGLEPFDRIRSYRLGGVERQFPAGKIETFSLGGTKPLDAQVECKIRRACDFGAIVMNRAQPRQRPLNECYWRQQHAERADVEGLQNVQDEPHVVIERHPAHIG